MLFQGKISDLERRTTQGFARGNVTIEGMGQYNGDRMRIEFQNENLIARIDGEVVCIVPDLICVVDTERGEPITTELLRYGFRVTVLGFPGPHLWTASAGTGRGRTQSLWLRRGIHPAGAGWERPLTPWETLAQLPATSPNCHSERSEESASQGDKRTYRQDAHPTTRQPVHPPTPYFLRRQEPRGGGAGSDDRTL